MVALLTRPLLVLLQANSARVLHVSPPHRITETYPEGVDGLYQTTPRPEGLPQMLI